MRRLSSNDYDSQPAPPERQPNAAEQFAAWVRHDRLSAYTAPTPEAHDALSAPGDVNPDEVLGLLNPGRITWIAADQERAANPTRFGEWAAERYTPSSDTPEAQSLARYLNRSHTN